jgi:hypothetical protein
LDAKDIIRLETDAANATGLNKGRCRFTTLSVCYGPTGTIKYKLLLQLLKSWIFTIKNIHKLNKLHDLRSAWSKAVQYYKQQPSPISKVKARGIMSNVITLLLDMNWKPLTYNCWQDPNDKYFVLDDYTIAPHNFAKTFNKWYIIPDLLRADRHFDAGGILHGIDFETTLSLIRSFHKIEFYAFKCTLETILTGAIWTAFRLHETNPDHCPMCPRCNLHIEDSSGVGTTSRVFKRRLRARKGPDSSLPLGACSVITRPPSCVALGRRARHIGAKSTCWPALSQCQQKSPATLDSSLAPGSLGPSYG